MPDSLKIDNFCLKEESFPWMNNQTEKVGLTREEKKGRFLLFHSEFFHSCRGNEHDGLEMKQIGASDF